jgi:hypothetical protein
MRCTYRSRAQWADDIRLLPMLACAAGGPLAAPHKAALSLPVPRGSFVELGAYNGLSNSNTFMLERCFAWRGLLIEASPSNYKMLAISSNRTAHKVHSAVCAAPGGVVEVSAVGDQMGVEIALIPEAAMRKFKERLKLASSVATVPCAPLGELSERGCRRRRGQGTADSGPGTFQGRPRRDQRVRGRREESRGPSAAQQRWLGARREAWQSREPCVRTPRSARALWLRGQPDMLPNQTRLRPATYGLPEVPRLQRPSGATWPIVKR